MSRAHALARGLEAQRTCGGIPLSTSPASLRCSITSNWTFGNGGWQHRGDRWERQRVADPMGVGHSSITCSDRQVRFSRRGQTRPCANRGYLRVGVAVRGNRPSPFEMLALKYICQA